MLALTAAAWMLLLAAPGRMALHVHPAAVSGSATFAMLLAHNPPAALAADWALMLAAMMLPMVIAPVRYVRVCSFARRRLRATALFLTGYAAVWMAAGAALLPVALAARQFGAGSWWPAFLVILAALVWECSPVKQQCLNRGHAHPAIAAFGAAADLDALGFGAAHGFWCVGSCWPPMLMPLLVANGHMLAMAAATLWLAGQKLDRPMPPGWRVRVPVKAARLVVAQGRTVMAVHGPDQNSFGISRKRVRSQYSA